MASVSRKRPAAQTDLPIATPDQYRDAVKRARVEGSSGWHGRASAELLKSNLKLPSASLIVRREAAEACKRDEYVCMLSAGASSGVPHRNLWGASLVVNLLVGSLQPSA